VPLKISEEEIIQRQETFMKKLKENQIDGAVLFKDTDIFYLTGFKFTSTERPIALIFDDKGKTTIFVPLLEKGYAQVNAKVDKVFAYPEYPGLKHPMQYLKEEIESLRLQERSIGVDSDGYSSPFGYRGPNLSDIISFKRLTNIYNIVEEMRFIKSSKEIELIKTSCEWGEHAHKLLQKYSKAGVNEIEIATKATSEATLNMTNALGSEYVPHGSPAFAEFRGQIGPMSAYPHVTTQNLTLKKRDNLVTSAAADVWGYHSELERTMFVAEVNSEQEKFFNFMYEAQEIAFKNIKPGKTHASIDKEVQRYIDENNLRKYAPHHTGHNIGLMMHEAPFLDLGDETLLEEGMILTIEPGLFVEGLGGFRHSDTVVVTKTGIEKLTNYPRDLESLIC